MKKRLLALLLMFSFFTVGAYAANQYQKTIDVSYDVNLSINGQSPKLTDVNGNTVLPFTYQGTTYVPIRAVGSYLGADISYNAQSHTALITSASSTSDNTLDSIYNRNMYTLNLLDHCTDLNTAIYVETLKLDSLLFNPAVGNEYIADCYETYDVLQAICNELNTLISNSSSQTPNYYEDLRSLMYDIKDNFSQYTAALAFFKAYHETDISSYADSFLNTLSKVTSNYLSANDTINALQSEFWS